VFLTAVSIPEGTIRAAPLRPDIHYRRRLKKMGSADQLLRQYDRPGKLRIEKKYRGKYRLGLKGFCLFSEINSLDFVYHLHDLPCYYQCN